MNKRTLRRRLAASGSLLSLGLVAACGGGDAGSAEAAVTEATGPIDYAYWGSPARAEKVEQVIDLFEAAQDDVTVTGEVADYVAYIERLTVRAAGDDLACATGTQSTFLAQYAQQGAFQDLAPYIDEGLIDTSGIPEDVLAAGQVDGVQYMIPTGTFLRLLAYNTALVEGAGVEPPAADMTWEEYGDWLRELQAGLPDGVFATEIEGANLFTLYSWVTGHGQPMFDGTELGFDKELLTEWFEFWLALTEDGATVPPERIADQFGALELAPMATGVAATGTRDIPHMHITEQALAGAGQTTTIASVSNPTEDPEQSSNVLGSNGISISSGCENGGAAATWIDFFANDTDAALAFQSDNGILTNTAAQDALLADAATPEGVHQNVTILRDYVAAEDTTTITYPAGVSVLGTELRRVYEDVAFGRSSVEQAVDTFFSEASRALG